MSTHYGRMIHEDDRTIMFANPEDAAEYIGFDLKRHRRAERHHHCARTRDLPRRSRCTRRTARSTSSSTATCTTGTPARTTGCRAHEQYAKGWIECFHAYQGLGPAGDALADREVPEVLRGRPDEGRLRGRPRRRGDLPADVPEGVVPDGFNTTEQNGALAEKHPGKFIVNTRWDPREGDAGLKELEENVERWGSKGVKLYTAEWRGRVPRLDAEGPRGLPVPGEVPGARHQEHPRPQGPDDLAAGQGRLRRRRRRPRRDRLPRAELHRRARRAAADRGLLLHGDPGAQRLRRVCPWSSAGSCTPGRSSSPR